MTYLLNENDAEAVVKRLTDKEDLTAVMIDIEDYFDRSSLYVFDNWFEGVLVAGPIVKKYWIQITLKYPYNKMPDPSGGLRLTPHGTKISYRKAFEEKPLPINSPSDYKPGTKKPRMKKEPIWLVDVKIPRRFVEAVDQALLDTYADEMDETDEEEIEDANAAGAAGGMPGMGLTP